MNKDDDENEVQNTGASEEVQNIKEMGVTNISKPDERIQILPIIGQIEGHMVNLLKLKQQSMNMLFHN